MSISPMQPLPQPGPAEERRRYPEIYEFSEKQEREGRQRMKTAAIYGGAAGGVLLLLGYFLMSHFGSWTLIAGLLAGISVGELVRQSRYNSGRKMVLEAQESLIAVDTEHNTRQIVELLRRYVAAETGSSEK